MSISIHNRAVMRAHVRLIKEMDDESTAISLGVLLAADDCPHLAKVYNVPLPASPADPWVRRAVQIIQEEEDKIRNEPPL